MTNLYYVLYSPSEKKYVDENGEFCSYEQAERFSKHDEFALENAKIYAGDVKFVGPCEEGVEP